MSDTLIIYYSLEGNVDFIARNLAEKLNGDLCRLETVKNYPKSGLLKFFHGGKDVVSGAKPELKTEIPDCSSYSKVIVGGPVWASKPAASLNTLFEKINLFGKNFYAFASSAGGNADKCLKLMCEAAEKQGASVIACESFVNPLKKPEAALEKVNLFVQKISN